jgi:hypothetical protein
LGVSDFRFVIEYPSLVLLTYVLLFTIMLPIGIFYYRDILVIIKTRVFEMANGKYQNLSDLARAMGLSVSQVYRVRMGKRGINEKFIVGAKMAFPNHRLDELFYFHTEPTKGNLMKARASSQIIT